MLWNSYTLEEIYKTDIPVLDVHYMSASYPQGTQDGIHFNDEIVFKSAERELESYLSRDK